MIAPTAGMTIHPVRMSGTVVGAPATFQYFNRIQSQITDFVAANSRIRADFRAAAERAGCELFIPPLRLCGDNAAMIGCQGYYEYLAGHTAGSDLNAWASMDIEESFPPRH